MSVTSGFFNSLNGDRKYTAEQMSAIFDGIINNGVFANIGTAFGVNADGSDNEITVGIGRAWFDSTWLYNDAILPLTAEESELVLNRYDAVVIEIDHSDSGRKGDIKIVTGTPASEAEYPTMIHNAYVNQYPLAYIYRAAGSTVITQADITNMIGTSSCPYITGILQVVNIDNLVAQWQGEWDIWSAQWPQWQAAWDQWFDEQKDDVDAATSAWMSQAQSEFDTWFAGLETVLEGDVVANLAEAIVVLQQRFTTLAMEQAVYEAIQDSNNDTLLDSAGNPIEGRTVMGGSMETSDSDEDITPESIGAAKTIHASQHGKDGIDPITPEMIGAATIPRIRTISLPKAEWSSLSQTVSVPGVLADETAQKITVAPASASRAAYNTAVVQCTAQATNSLTFTAVEVPSGDLAVYITIEEVTSE